MAVLHLPEEGINMDRPTYHAEELESSPDGYGTKVKDEVRTPCEPAKANLVGSKVHNNIHLPMFDIDYEARLIPSSTEGHYHLYLDQPCTWRQYKRVLRAMAKAGIVQKGFAKMSIRRKQAFLRPPGVKKASAEAK